MELLNYDLLMTYSQEIKIKISQEFFEINLENTMRYIWLYLLMKTITKNDSYDDDENFDMNNVVFLYERLNIAQ